jgi:hypothetical protein
VARGKQRFRSKRCAGEGLGGVNEKRQVTNRHDVISSDDAFQAVADDSASHSNKETKMPIANKILSVVLSVGAIMVSVIEIHAQVLLNKRTHPPVSNEFA